MTLILLMFFLWQIGVVLFQDEDKQKEYWEGVIREFEQASGLKVV
jgi:hypothetical protein